MELQLADRFDSQPPLPPSWPLAVSPSHPPDPLPDDQGNVLMATKNGPPGSPPIRDHVVLTWDGALGPPTLASKWAVFMDEFKEEMPQGRLGVSAPFPLFVPTYTNFLAIIQLPVLKFYRVRGLSECFNDPGP